jgi:carboxypeptidase Taq
MLGNVYAAQLVEAARADLPQLDSAIACGNPAPLLGWLDTNVYMRGRSLNSRDMVETVTGRAVTADALLGYLTDKFVTNAADFVSG